MLVENYKVNTVIFNTGKYNYLEKRLIKILNEKNINYYKDVDSLSLKDNELYFLNTKIYGNENDNSNVIYLNYNNFKILLISLSNDLSFFNAFFIFSSTTSICVSVLLDILPVSHPKFL